MDLTGFGEKSSVTISQIFFRKIQKHFIFMRRLLLMFFMCVLAISSSGCKKARLRAQLKALMNSTVVLPERITCINKGEVYPMPDSLRQKPMFLYNVEVVLRPDECPSIFQVLPKRWIVERIFSWLENIRRPNIDYEFLAETAEAMVQLACVQIMRNKLFV